MSRSVSHFLESPMVEFNFAGFRSNAWTLQNQGWSLSARENVSLTRYGREVQIMLNRDGLTMVSSVELLDMGAMMKSLHEQMPVFMEIVGVGVNGRSTVIPVRPNPADFHFAVMSSEDAFLPIDASPRYTKIDLGAIDFARYGVFKRLNAGAEIYLPEKTVDELLKEILVKQVPRQKEIRKNQHRREYIEENFSEVSKNPNESIRAQLIAV